MDKKKIVYMTELAILAAIIILLSFTPIGYLHMGAVEITFITIPVVLGAIVMGPIAGGILGGVFGITSFIQCFGMSPLLGGPLLAINPALTFVLCFVPRILVGVLTGFIFKAFKNKNIVSFAVSSVAGSLINTLLFVGGIILMFGSSDFVTGLINTMGSGNVIIFFGAFVGVNGLVEAGACAVIGTAVSKSVYLFNSKMRR